MAGRIAPANGMKIGLALGSGSARGWSHIGVINALAEMGIRPDIICGTSIGALVGAACVSDRLGRLERWARSLSRLETARFFEINTAMNGFVNTRKLHQFLNEYVADDNTLIEQCDKTYAAIATDLESGREIWLSDGALIEAVWASISLPGLFPAIRYHEQWLVDGGLVNPVPISACRALGAEVVIAINLNGDIVGRHFNKANAALTEKRNGVVAKISDFVADYTTIFSSDANDKPEPPNLFEAIAGSINITQDRITRSRMAGDPPDILLAPRLSHIGLLEFYRADEAIREGEKCVRKMEEELTTLLSRARST